MLPKISNNSQTLLLRLETSSPDIYMGKPSLRLLCKALNHLSTLPSKKSVHTRIAVHMKSKLEA